MFKFKAETSADQRAELISMVKALKDKIDFLRSVEVGENFTESARAFDFVLIADVDDEAALKAYAVHPDHQPVIKRVGELCEPSRVVDFVRPGE